MAALLHPGERVLLGVWLSHGRRNRRFALQGAAHDEKKFG
jgi:hypothetical protein